MSATTVSAHTSTEIAERIDAIAKSERRNRSQIVAMALELFVELPPQARAAWLKISTTGSDRELKTLIDKISRTIVDLQYETVREQAIAQMQLEHIEPLATEDDILAAAVRITKSK
jgi:predicted transcriptional regulator